MNLHVVGSCCLRNVICGAQLDVKDEVMGKADRAGLLSKMSGVSGSWAVYVVLDKRPNGKELPSFADIFMGSMKSQAEMVVRPEAAERFRLLGHLRRHVNDLASIVTCPVKMRIPFPMGRYAVWSAFNDYASDSVGGNYKNTSKNALLFYCVLDSVLPVVAEFVMSFETSFWG